MRFGPRTKGLKIANFVKYSIDSANNNNKKKHDDNNNKIIMIFYISATPHIYGKGDMGNNICIFPKTFIKGIIRSFKLVTETSHAGLSYGHEAINL